MWHIIATPGPEPDPFFFEVKVVETFYVVPFTLAGGWGLEFGAHNLQVLWKPEGGSFMSLVPCVPTRGYEGEQIHKSIVGLLPRKHAKSQQLIT